MPTISSYDPTQSTSSPSSEHPEFSTNDPYIFATVRYDPTLLHSSQNTKASFNRPSPFYLLEHQWTRLQVANWCSSFYRTEPVQNTYSNPTAFLHSLLTAVKQWHSSHPNERPECLRIRIRCYVSGRIETIIGHPETVRPTNFLFPPSFGIPDQLPKTNWTIVLDVQATEISESTMYKTSDRKPYARPRVAAAIPDIATPKEVLLYNPEGHILDGSQSTPFFYRNGKWTVPNASSGGLQGTTRRWALENGLAVEDAVCKDSLEVGEVVWLSNAVWGFFYARFEIQDVTGEVPSSEECRRVEQLIAA
jgi:branched-subunit amino acid aminotransferase/4-amino-4-deoxychorismate lyase